MADVTAGNTTEERPRSEVINEKFGAFVKFASTSFTRARQFTVERLGRAESVTSYDDDFETLSQKVDQIKLTTERTISTLEAMVQPNPNIRLEEMVYSKFNEKATAPHHSSPHELLGVELTRAGNEYGPETQYGGYLVRCGDVETKVGLSERRFQSTIRTDVLTPLKAFLEVDLKNVIKERKALVLIRLDLDAAKSQVKKTQPGEKLQQAESHLRSVQADYDIQLDKIRSLMEKIVQTHVNNLGHMKSMMSAMKTYHTECIAHLDEIGAEISMSSLMTAATIRSSESPSSGDYVLDKDKSKKARVLYDYEAEDNSGLSLLTDQVIVVYPLEDEEDYFVAHVGDITGKVPAAYLELI